MMKPVVSINLARIRKNAQSIKDRTGVPIIAVVKADAYGLGAPEVAGAIGDLVEAFYVFETPEAIAARLWDITGKRIISLNTQESAGDLRQHHIQPVAWSVQQAAELRVAHPVLSIDTGQQRFAAAREIADQVCIAGDCREAMTHATKIEHVDLLLQTIAGWSDRKLFLHAAGSALLDEPRACLNAVRPGLALYQGAVKVSAPLVDVRESNRPAGYTGFVTPRFGVVLAGYSNGMLKGPCRVNGQIRQVLEVGMQSCFIEAGPGDQIGDAVELLGDTPGIDLPGIARAWGASQQEVLVQLCRAGKRVYA
jgi:alanine racemase